MTNEEQLGDRLISVKDVGRLLSLSRAQVYRLKDAGKLPPAVYPSERALRWRLSDIRAYIHQL
jgi:predicted DNA-binding transcriptional regulator AlpA